MFVLAHLSDPHLAPLPPPQWRELASKRVLGFLDWVYQRRAIHRADVVSKIVDDLTSQSPDHIAVTGDLVNIALLREFANAQNWLQRLGRAHDVTLVPGNHDAYVQSVASAPAHFWGDYMRADDTHIDAGEPTAFPFVRRRGGIAVIGLSTALATPWFMATGRLGAEQTNRCAEILGRLADEGLYRIVLIHHPPAGHRIAIRRLTDAEAFRRVLKERGAELVLHGHDHVASLDWLEGPTGRIPVVGVPSASAHSDRHVPAAYNLYYINKGASGGWTCEIVSRGFRTGGKAIVELSRQTIATN